jgi:hypothetical protein
MEGGRWDMDMAVSGVRYAWAWKWVVGSGEWRRRGRVSECGGIKSKSYNIDVG